MSLASSGQDSPRKTSHNQPSPSSAASYVSYPVSHIATSLYRRLTDNTSPSTSRKSSQLNLNTSTSTVDNHSADSYTPPHRGLSPFQPPPLTALSLYTGQSDSDDAFRPILSKSIAEEVRLLIPPRLQLAGAWSLAYSLENDGVSLGTLYKKCAAPVDSSNDHQISDIGGFVLVVQDANGGIFGAFLTDPPRVSSSFYGTGECFLWRAGHIGGTPITPSTTDDIFKDNKTTQTVPNHNLTAQERQTKRDIEVNDLLIADLPPPPSMVDDMDQLKIGRSTTISVESESTSQVVDSIRFKAYPYSGVNDYIIFCRPDYLSIGGGDGKYGLWLDEVLETGVSGNCMTFGNEPLSESGGKFDVVGVEVWCIGG